MSNQRIGSVNQIISNISSGQISLALCILGIILRLVLYFDNRPFWADEAQLALNIRDRSFSGLTQHLDYCQAAPLGFLIAEKWLSLSLGNNEYVLRLIPLLSGVAALLLFWLLAKRLLSDTAVTVAVGLFAVCGPLIRYCSELKPYSLDLFFGILLFLIADQVMRKSNNMVALISLALAAVFTPWLSYGSLCVMPAVLIGTTISFLHQKRSRQVIAVSLISMLWATSLFLVYVSSLEDLNHTAAQAALMTPNAVLPDNLDAVWWMRLKLEELPQSPGGLSVIAVGLACLYAAAGVLNLASKTSTTTTYLALPLVITLAASCLGIYPFLSRFLFVLVPSLFIFIAEGATWFYKIVGKQSIPVAILGIALLFVPRFNWLDLPTGKLAAGPEIKATLAYLAAHRKPGDIIYVYYGAYFPVLYYCNSYGFSEHDFRVSVPGLWANDDLRRSLLNAWQRSYPNTIVASEYAAKRYRRGDYSPQWKLFQDDINRLSGNSRVWVVFSLYIWDGSNEEKLFLYFLDSIGRQLDAFRCPGASIYLYDLSRPAGQSVQSAH
jgi:hypothetical protein